MIRLKLHGHEKLLIIIIVKLVAQKKKLIRRIYIGPPFPNSSSVATSSTSYYVRF